MKTLEEGRVRKENKQDIVLTAILICFGFVLLFFMIRNLTDGRIARSTAQQTRSDLINTKEIATLSVSEFIYNGIAQAVKEDGEIDYNVLYRSTVKVSVDANQIEYRIDETKKTVTFVFPEFTIENPVIDIGSISFIPNRTDLYIDDVIALCRSDALAEASGSEKLMSSAQENLRSVTEAWYSPILEGYTFEYRFGTGEGGEAE